MSGNTFTYPETDADERAFKAVVDLCSLGQTSCEGRPPSNCNAFGRLNDDGTVDVAYDDGDIDEELDAGAVRLVDAAPAAATPATPPPSPSLPPPPPVAVAMTTTTTT